MCWNSLNKIEIICFLTWLNLIVIYSGVYFNIKTFYLPVKLLNNPYFSPSNPWHSMNLCHLCIVPWYYTAFPWGYEFSSLVGKGRLLLCFDEKNHSDFIWLEQSEWCNPLRMKTVVRTENLCLCFSQVRLIASS